MREPQSNLESPAPTRGVFLWLRLGVGTCAFVAFCVLLATLAMTRPAAGEVFVTPEQLAQRIAAEPQRDPATDVEGDWHAAVRPLVIVHVGHGRKGYDRGHISGAIYVEGRETYASRDGVDTVLPTPNAFADWLGNHGIGPDMDVLLYGDAAGVFPARVYAGLNMLGLDTHARLLDGHLREWVAEGRTVSTEATPAREPIVVPVSGLAARKTTHADALVLDARAPKSFAGDARVPETEQRGHIAGSINLPWRRLIPDITRPVMIADAERMIADAIDGHAEGTMLMTTDDRGNGSAVLFAIVKHFGWDAVWDERGLPGYALDGGALVTPVNPVPSTDATP
ncbi:MAG: rhodanese-like domain-containing protein [Planctomycetota bacterium]